MKVLLKALLVFTLGLIAVGATGVLRASEQELRGTGDLGIVIERATGSLLIVDTTGRKTLSRVEGLGDLSHASAVFSRDQRYAFVFGRDGGLTKVDLLTGSIAGRVVQAGNSIGGAISDDGTLVAVSNYEPGGVRLLRSPTFRRRGRGVYRRRSALSMRPAAGSFSRFGTQAKPGSPISRKVLHPASSPNWKASAPTPTTP